MMGFKRFAMTSSAAAVCLALMISGCSKPEEPAEGAAGMEGMSGMSGMEGSSGMEGMEGMSGMAGAEGGEDAAALAQASGCLACHNADTKLVGPAYKEIAAKYAGDDAARDMLIAKVKNGGVGTWGQIPMPPNAHIADDKIATLVDWILAM